MNRPYRISFDTYQNRIESAWVLDVMAHNMKEARSIAENIWYEQRRNKAHMFHIAVTKFERMEHREPHRTNWKGYTWGYHG